MCPLRMCAPSGKVLSVNFATLQGKTESEKKKFAEFFSEVQRAVDSKQLRPMIRTQYMRTAFQVKALADIRPEHSMP